MAEERCPHCRSARVRRASTTLQHLVRTLSRDPKRYCLDCKKRWLAAEVGGR